MTAPMTAEELRGLRQGLGYTQREMANELGISARTYQRWEREGVRPLGAEAVRRMR